MLTSITLQWMIYNVEEFGVFFKYKVFCSSLRLSILIIHIYIMIQGCRTTTRNLLFRTSMLDQSPLPEHFTLLIE